MKNNPNFQTFQSKLVKERRCLSSYERSLRDLDEGRVYKYDSLDDLIKEMLNTGTHSDLFSKKYKK